MTLGKSQKACVGDSFDMNLSLCAVKEDLRKMKTFFLSFWTNFRKKMRSSYKSFVNFTSFAIQLGSRSRYQINDYIGVFRTQWNSYDGVFCENSQRPKAKKLHRRYSTGF